MGGDNYRQEDRRRYVKCLEVEAEKLLLNRDLLDIGFGMGSESAAGPGASTGLG